MSSDSSSDGFNALGHDNQRFRKIARTQPGVYMASVICSTRNQLGQQGMDADVGTTGSVFRKWFDSVFLVRHPKNRIDKGKFDELVMLIQAADELYHGRTLEVGDILMSCLRSLIFGLERGEWEVAGELLTYTWDDQQYVPEHVVDEAVKEAVRRRKRESDLAAVGCRSACR